MVTSNRGAVAPQSLQWRQERRDLHRRLRLFAARGRDNPPRDMVLVAAAGPAMNIALAVVAALLFHLIGYLPNTLAPWVTENLKNGLVVNVVLAVFNLFPIPPLDGGRILVGILPKV